MSAKHQVASSSEGSMENEKSFNPNSFGFKYCLSAAAATVAETGAYCLSVSVNIDVKIAFPRKLIS